jgi:hypothetical protein
VDYFKELMSAKEVAREAGVNYVWLMRQHIQQELIDGGLAARIGKPLICHESAVEYLKSRPETRGRK